VEQFNVYVIKIEVPCKWYMHVGSLQIYLYKWEWQLIARQFSGETNSLFGIVIDLSQ